MNGIINVLKPPKMTSHDVINFLRKLFNIKKIGHTGTLDPDACGVLVVCIGNATKVIEYLNNDKKKYRAELHLGVSTDTQDSSGKITSYKDVIEPYDSLVKTVESFKGKITQIPPMYSALKKNGKKLYELARKGIEVDREQREIEIHDIKVLKYDLKSHKLMFDVECSKGTYIRTLCSDIGDKVGCGGHMSFLLRLETGVFKIENSFTLEEIEELYKSSRYQTFLKDIDIVFSDVPRVTIKDESLKWILNGGEIFDKDLTAKQDVKTGFIRIYDSNNLFLALYKVDNSQKEKRYIPEKMFNI